MHLVDVEITMQEFITAMHKAIEAAKEAKFTDEQRMSRLLRMQNIINKEISEEDNVII